MPRCARPPRPTSASGSTRPRPPIYRFIWSDLADWYIEQIKPRLYGDLARRRRGPGGGGADVRRGAPAAASGHAVHHRGAVAAVSRPAGDRLDLGRALAAARPRGPQIPTRCANSGWCRSWSSAIRAIRAEYGVQPGQAVRAVVSGDGQATPAALRAGARHRSPPGQARPSSSFGETPGAGRRPRRALRRHRRLRSAGRRHRHRPGMRPARQRGGPADASGRVAGEEAGQRAVRGPGARGRGRARTPEAHHLEGAGEVLVRKRELLGCGWRMEAGRRDARVHAVASRPSLLPACRLRPHRAAAGRPAGRGAAPARRHAAGLFAVLRRLQRRRRVPVRRGGLRRRHPEPGRGHRRARAAGHPLAHQPGARGQLAAAIGSRCGPRRAGGPTGSTGSSSSPA